MESPFPPRSLFLAPMVELSHKPLRILVREFGGLDIACTEMASASLFLSGSANESWYLDPEPESERTMLQFYTMRGRTAPLLEALERCSDLGVMGADINFGCAAPRISRAGGGAAWLEDPAGARNLVAEARRVWPKLLSAKLRIGAEEDYPRLRDFCLGLVDAGLDFLSLHPRLSNEKFRRKSRWDFVAALGRDLSVPVVGNGDVRSYTDYRERVERYSPAGIMIGREAARRPWIFALIRGREADAGFSLEVDLLATAERLLDLLEEHIPPEYRLERARRFFAYYSDNFTFAHHITWRLQNSPDLGSMRAALEAYIAEVPADRRKVYSD